MNATSLRDLLRQAVDRRNAEGRDASFRALQEAVEAEEIARPRGLSLNRTTASQILRGTYKGEASDGTIRAIGWLAGVGDEDAFAAAGRRSPGLPFAEELPPGVDDLSPKERRAAIEMLRTLVAQRREINRYVDSSTGTQEPRTPRKATPRQKSSASREYDAAPAIRARAIKIEMDGSVHAEPEDIPVSASTLEEALQELLDRYTDQGFVVDTDNGVADTGADVFVHGERFDMVIELKDQDSQFRPSADLVEVAMRYVMNARNRDVQAASDAGARQSNYELANRRGGGKSEGRRRREEQDRDAERGEE